MAPCVQHHNNELGRQLDKALVDEFDLFRSLTESPRKKGKDPQIDSRGNMVGLWQGSEPILFINMDRKSVVSKFGRVGKLVAQSGM